MSRLGLSLAVAVAVVLALASGAASQAPGPLPSVDCTSSLAKLMGCLAYVQQGSVQGKPTAPCCNGVKAALKSPATVACLCTAFGHNYGIPVNFTRAAGLPAACGQNPNALSKCNIKVPGAPASAPRPYGMAPASGPASAGPSPGSPKSAAVMQSPVSVFAVLAAVAATLLSHFSCEDAWCFGDWF